MSTINNVSLLFWNLGEGDPPSVSAVRDSLAAAGLSATYAETVPVSTAFRRACDAKRKKTTLVRVFKNNGDLHWQIDEESIENNRLERRMVGVYRLHATNTVRGVGFDFDRDLEQFLDTEFGKAVRTYEWGDVSTIIKNIIDKCGLGAYSPRKSGGVYFVPENPERPRMLDQIEQFCTDIGIRFLRYTIPDTAAQRAEIMDAVSHGLEQDVIAHEQAIEEYSAESPSKALEKRVASIEATMALLDRLQHLIAGRHAALHYRLSNAKTRVEELAGAVRSAVVTPGTRKLNYA